MDGPRSWMVPGVDGPCHSRAGTVQAMSRAPQRTLALALLTLGAVVLAGCSNPSADRLLLADAPAQDTAIPGVDDGALPIWAVSPGEQPGESNLVTSSAFSPLEIVTLDDHGLPWVNSFGREWQQSVLVAFGADDGANVVRAVQPGGQPTDLARAPQVRTTVLRRGAFIQTSGGCVLASTPDSADEVGEGLCTISSDERWVVSWRRGESGLSIRDLRSGDVNTADDLQVLNAAALATDARVLATVLDGEQVRAVLLDARTGDEVARSTPYRLLEVSNLTAEADGFVLQSRNAEGDVELLHMSTDGTIETIDTGPLLIPLTNSGKVTYLRFENDLAQSSLRRWSPGSQPSTLLEGYLGAAAVDQKHVIATVETEDSIDIYREDPGTAKMRQVVSLELADGDQSPLGGTALGVSVPRAWVKGSTAYLQVDQQETSSFVRVDLKGDHSDVPVRQVRGLRLESLDSDGTALLSRVTGEQAERRTELLVVRSGDHDVDVRATLGEIDLALIRKGKIYVTDGSDPNRFTVRSVRASGGDRDVSELYANKQLAGATWPEHGGATSAFMITPRLLIEQQQQAAEQQQAADAARAQALEQAQQGG